MSSHNGWTCTRCGKQQDIWDERCTCPGERTEEELASGQDMGYREQFHEKIRASFRDKPMPWAASLLNFEPLTERDIARARELIAEHPEWDIK